MFLKNINKSWMVTDSIFCAQYLWWTAGILRPTAGLKSTLLNKVIHPQLRGGIPKLQRSNFSCWFGSNGLNDFAHASDWPASSKCGLIWRFQGHCRRMRGNLKRGKSCDMASGNNIQRSLKDLIARRAYLNRTPKMLTSRNLQRTGSRMKSGRLHLEGLII